MLEFSVASDLSIAYPYFDKKEEHLVTFRNVVAKTQIDYLLLRKGIDVYVRIVRSFR